jgi:hypothetical protein
MAERTRDAAVKCGSRRTATPAAHHEHRGVAALRNRNQAADGLSHLDTQVGIETAGLPGDTAEQGAGLGPGDHTELPLAAGDAARSRNDRHVGHPDEHQAHTETIRERSGVSDDRRCARGPTHPADQRRSHLELSISGCPDPPSAGMGGSLHFAGGSRMRFSERPARKGILMSVAPEPLRHDDTARRLAPDGRACPLRCGSCGYEIVNFRVLPPCPMCRKLCWEPAPWRASTWERV